MRIYALFPARSIAANAPVAQLDRAPDYESGGQGFESLRVYHFQSLVIKGLRGFFCKFLVKKLPDCRKMRVLTGSIAGSVAGNFLRVGICRSDGDPGDVVFL